MRWTCPVFAAACILASASCDRRESPPAEAAVDSIHSVEYAERLLRAGQPEQAARSAKALLATSKDDWRVYDVLARVQLQRALALQDQGLMDRGAETMSDALERYRDAITCAPDVKGLTLSGGSTAQLAGDLDQAEAWFREAMRLDPDDPRPPMYIAQLVFESDAAEARSLLEQAIELDPYVAEAHASLALLEAQESHEEVAEAHLKRALACDRGTPIRVVQARVYRTLGDPARGVQVLTALPRGALGAEAAAAELAACWEALDRPDRAAEAWEACFGANAHRSDAWRYAISAAKAHLAAGDRAAASRLIEQAELLSPPAAEIAQVRAAASAQSE